MDLSRVGQHARPERPAAVRQNQTRRAHESDKVLCTGS
jgi:hypothetical protein